MSQLESKDRDRLASGGYTACAGSACLDGPASQLIDSWRAYLPRVLAGYIQTESHTPLLIDARTLSRSGYARNFPQHVVFARGSAPNGLLRSLSPAACLHVYSALKGQRLSSRSRRTWVEGPVARYESGRWRFPFRLASFHMAELVMMGEPGRVERDAEALCGLMTAAFEGLGLGGEWRRATDPFYGPARRGARVLQRLRGSKLEYWPSSSGVAVASLNRHDDTFGTAFAIRVANGPAHSACAAFGLERLTAVSLIRWGPRPEGWPAGLRP